MSDWHLGPLAPFDLESTGIEVFDARIVTGYVGRAGAGFQAEHHDWLVNPAVAIPEEAARIHGITTEHAFEHGLAAPVAVAEITQAVADALGEGIPIVGWNVVYDLSLLHAECVRNGVATVAQRLGRDVLPVVDGLVLDKQVAQRVKGAGGRKLVNAAPRWGVELSDIDAHGARADAIAAARIVWRIASQHPRIAGMTLLELHDAQVAWAREQADGLRAYFDRKGIEHDGVDGTWPVRVQTSGAAVSGVA